MSKSTYQETTLPNGLRVVTEHMSGIESVSVGVYIGAGSRFEDEENNGVAHFLEHMAFKGTKKRTAEQISFEVEDVGGNMNAYTSRETTAYHMKVLKEDMPMAVDVLADILMNSTFLEEEMERERQVVLQEIRSYEDMPDEVVFDNLQLQTFPHQPLGRNILGTPETVKNMTEAKLREFMAKYYVPNNMILSAAGSIDHEAFVKEAQKHFGSMAGEAFVKKPEATYEVNDVAEYKKIEQAHVAISYAGLSLADPKHYAAHIWSSLLGGGSSSRLFLEVREKQGLAYSIYSYLSSYSDIGVFGLYAATDPGHVQKILDTLNKVIAETANTLTEEEIKRAKAQLKAGVRMAQESTDARMGRMARNLFTYGRHVPLSEILEKIDEVTLEDVRTVGVELCNPETRSLSIYGPVGDASEEEVA